MPDLENMTEEQLEELRRMLEDLDTIDVVGDDMRALSRSAGPGC